MLFRSDGSAFDVYPNPATNSCTLRIPQIALGGMVKLYDAVGREVFSAIASTSNIQLPASDLSGVYLIKVISQDEVMSKTLIVE